MTVKRLRCVACDGTYEPDQPSGRYFHVCPEDRAAAPASERAARAAVTPSARIAIASRRDENVAPDFVPPAGKRPQEYEPPMISEGLGAVELAERE